MDLTIKQIYEYFDNIGCCVFATIDNDYPQTRIAHFRAFDDDGIYFMTMDCKPFYDQLTATKKVSVCGLSANSKVSKNNDEYVFDPGYSIRLTGNVKQISFDDIIAKNNPVFDLCIADQKAYPSMVIFVVDSASGEVFDYDFEMTNRDHKLKRLAFSYNCSINNNDDSNEITDTNVTKKINNTKFFKILDHCTKCGSCKRACSFKAIEKVDGKFIIDKTKCDQCGRCENVCPIGAIGY